MQIILDTNCLVRFFTKDIEDKAIMVKELLRSEKELYIPDVVLPELEYILTKKYVISRKELLDMFQFLASQNSITISSYSRKAIRIFENSLLDMTDCIIAAYSFKGELASFDRELLRVEGIKRYWKKD